MGIYVKAAWLGTLLIAAAPLSAAEGYRIEAAQSRVEISVRRFGIVWLRAGFRDLSGEFVLDRTGNRNRIDVTVAAGSVETQDGRWTSRLRSADWLDVQRYPQIVFHATRSHFDNARSATVSGNLTLRGTTRPETLIVDDVDCPPARGQSTCRFTAHAHIRRSDYGLPHGFWLAGDEVEITVTGSARRNAPKAP